MLQSSLVLTPSSIPQVETPCCKISGPSSLPCTGVNDTAPAAASYQEDFETEAEKKVPSSWPTGKKLPGRLQQYPQHPLDSVTSRTHSATQTHQPHHTPLGQPSTASAAAPRQALPTPAGRTADSTGTRAIYSSWKNSRPYRYQGHLH